MIRRVLFIPILCATFSLGSIPAKAQIAQPDSFTQINANAMAANPAGVELHLSLEGGRKTFHMGEPIPITYSFTSSKRGAYQLIKWNTQFFDTFTCDPAASVAESDADLFKSNVFNINGYAPAPVTLGIYPTKEVKLLNSYCRFISPGHYRIYATCGRVTTRSAAMGQSNKPASVTSDILELDIAPDDPAWDNAQLDTLRKNLHSSDEAVQANAQRDLAFLGTNDAVTETLKQLNGSPLYANRIIDSLFEARDRKFVIDSLKNALVDPNFAVTDNLIDALARLDITMRHPLLHPSAGPDHAYTVEAIEREKLIFRERPTVLAVYCKILQDAIERKTGRAKAMSIVTLLTNAAKYPDTFVISAAQRRAMAAALRASLPLLSKTEQSFVLSGPCWPAIKPLDIAPYLKEASCLPGTIISDPDNYDLRDAAVKRLLEVSPADARNIIISDIRSGNPQIGYDTLQMLPDIEIPSLDPTFKNYLPKGNVTSPTYATFVSRYATKALLPTALAVYPKVVDTTAIESLLTYVLRVDEPLGRKMADAELTRREKQGYILLPNLITTKPTPAIERLVQSHLHDKNKATAAEAKMALDRLKMFKQAK